MLTLKVSVAIPAMGSLTSLSWRKEDVCGCCAWLHELLQHDSVLASGCELCRMTRDVLFVGEPVI